MCWSKTRHNGVRTTALLSPDGACAGVLQRTLVTETDDAGTSTSPNAQNTLPGEAASESKLPDKEIMVPPRRGPLLGTTVETTGTKCTFISALTMTESTPFHCSNMSKWTFDLSPVAMLTMSLSPLGNTQVASDTDLTVRSAVIVAPLAACTHMHFCRLLPTRTNEFPRTVTSTPTVLEESTTSVLGTTSSTTGAE